MKNSLSILGRKRRLFACWLLAFSLLSVAALAQRPSPRITTDIDNSERVAIKGSHSPIARIENDIGRVPSETKLQGVNLVFSRSAVQEAELRNLIAAQQNPASPLYHKWLTPDEFAARFGVTDSDIAQVQSWLERQGFSVDGVSRSKNRVSFSGTVGQAEAAFGAELHYYEVNGETHFAPSAEFSVPAALTSLVQNVTNLSTFRPKPRVKMRPSFTSGQSGKHFVTPKDIATIYDITPAYSAGLTGTNQTIAVVGQSEINLSDIENFQRAAGLPVKDPTLVLVPNSGTPTVSLGDEAESDLDLEYSGGIATGGTIYFVYTGDSPSYSVFDSLQYAIDKRIASVISVSYGACEAGLSSSDYSTLNDVILAQAATQGQSVVVAAGDNGSTDCYAEQGLTQSQQEALAVDFPSSSQYVTAIGGTEFPSADVASSNTTYWASASGTDVVSSALSYIPEQVWNDDSSTNGLASGGGGVSTLTARPSWQSGVTGIPSGSYRLVPDISLDASPNNAGYLLCSSDSSTKVTGSCSHGFRDSNNQYLTVAGGTSFGAPIFAGMLAIINDKLQSTGQGVINPTLYTLAAKPNTYASAFHDIISGSNKCTAGSNFCSAPGASEYPASAGYDEASGLGSVDFYNLLTAWPASSSSPLPSNTTLSATTITPAPGTNDTITITVASNSSSSTPTPTGTVTIVVDGAMETSSLALSNGSATYGFSSTIVGAHVIMATYSGDSTYASSSGTLTVTVTLSKSFTLTATNAAVYDGSSGTSTISITPKNGYTGTIGWSISSSPSLSNGCFSLPNTAVTGTNTIATTMTVHASAPACTSSALSGPGGTAAVAVPARHDDRVTSALHHKAPASLAMLALLLAGLLGFRFRSSGLGTIGAICLLGAIGFAIAGCGGSGSSPEPAKGSYKVTIVGTDTSSSSITASTSMTLTIN